MTEKQWQAQVIELARLYQWWIFHPFDSRKSSHGWPDLTLIRPPEFVLAELKTEKGRLSTAQTDVIERLRACGLDVAVWRPSDFDHVHERLSPSLPDPFVSGLFDGRCMR